VRGTGPASVQSPCKRQGPASPRRAVHPSRRSRRRPQRAACACVAAGTAAVLVVLLFFTAGIRWGRDRDPNPRVDTRWSVFRVAEEGMASLGQWQAQALQAQESTAAAPAATQARAAR
jgi:hypothetical protein